MNGRFPQSLYWTFFAVYCGGLTWLFYGNSVTLPFFFDDFVHYPFVESNNVLQIWFSTAELAYYRPLNFTLWRITYEVLQHHNPQVDHAVNLILHAANSFMAGWLAARLWDLRGDRFPVVSRDEAQIDWWRALLSATLFLLFPFSYQAVPWAGSLSHLLVTSLVLLSLLFFVQMRRTKVTIWGIASLLVAIIAPFAHENGVLIMPFLVLVDLTTPVLSRRWRQAIRTAVIWSLPLAIYLPAWFSLPRLSEGRLFDNNLEGILQNTAYFAQGAFYPFTRFGGWLTFERGMNDMTAVALLSGLALAVAIIIQLMHRATLRSLLPWSWIGLASLPAILFLVFEYVINGPRLLMLAGVGVAWLWADVILLFTRGGKRGSLERLARVVVAVTFTLLLLVHNANFLRERMVMHKILGDGFQQVVAITSEANAAGQKAVVVNFPSWLAPKHADFALGHEGVLFWPDYVPPEVFMAIHTGEPGDLNFVKVDGIRPALENYFYGLTGPNPDWASISAVPSQVFGTDYAPDKLTLSPVGELGSHQRDQPAPLAIFTGTGGEENIKLLSAQALLEADGIKIESLWQASGVSPQTTVFVHLVDNAGNLVAQADGDPLGGSYPMEIWVGDGLVLDKRSIDLANTQDIGIRLGLYDRLTGMRLVAGEENGNLYPENAVPLPLISNGP